MGQDKKQNIEPGSERTVALDRQRRSGRRSHSDELDGEAIARATRHDILQAATHEFVKHGFEAASINKIAAQSQSSKRMLYYHFESKRGLYQAVLEAAYERVGRQASSRVEERTLSPMEALRQYAEEPFLNFLNNEDFVRLVMAENLSDAQAISESKLIRERNILNFSSLEKIWRRGCADGSMRDDIRIIDLYFAIVSISFHAVSNRATLKATLGVDMATAEEIEHRRKLVGDVACSYVARTSK